MNPSFKTRLVDFDGTRNFRDLGGYETGSGGAITWARVYRSDGLQHLTEQDLRTFESLGVSAVFDLRRDAERSALPNRVESTPNCMATPVDQVSVAAINRSSLSSVDRGEALLAAMYKNMIRHSGMVVGRVLKAIADPDQGAVVFHCHAGKDRTGVVAALLLEAVGVDREVVLDDYELTAEAGLLEGNKTSFDALVRQGLSPEAALGVLGTPRWAMAEGLAMLDSELGGIEVYLVERAGLTRSDVSGLRRRLVS